MYSTVHRTAVNRTAVLITIRLLRMRYWSQALTDGRLDSWCHDTMPNCTSLTADCMLGWQDPACRPCAPVQATSPAIQTMPSRIKRAACESLAAHLRCADWPACAPYELHAPSECMLGCQLPESGLAPSHHDACSAAQHPQSGQRSSCSLLPFYPWTSVCE